MVGTRLESGLEQPLRTRLLGLLTHLFDQPDSDMRWEALEAVGKGLHAGLDEPHLSKVVNLLTDLITADDFVRGFTSRLITDLVSERWWVGSAAARDLLRSHLLPYVWSRWRGRCVARAYLAVPMRQPQP